LSFAIAEKSLVNDVTVMETFVLPPVVVVLLDFPLDELPHPASATAAAMATDAIPARRYEDLLMRAPLLCLSCVSPANTEDLLSIFAPQLQA
jgi:hypothetical protein